MGPRRVFIQGNQLQWADETPSWEALACTAAHRFLDQAHTDLFILDIGRFQGRLLLL